jgi:hypothetical protein
MNLSNTGKHFKHAKNHTNPNNQILNDSGVFEMFENV